MRRGRVKGFIPWLITQRPAVIIMDWARERFGDEAWPIHGKAGSWHRGGATVYGWTWFGFDTEDRMREFQIKWGGTDQEHDGNPPEGAP